MPLTSLAVPHPSRDAADFSTERTAMLVKIVNGWGMCTTARINPETDPWYPPTESGARGAALAEMACRGCPVESACLELALRQEGRLGDIHGVRGGVSADDRRSMIRLRRGVVMS